MLWKEQKVARIHQQRALLTIAGEKFQKQESDSFVLRSLVS
jgi:hypothetical protein